MTEPLSETVLIENARAAIVEVLARMNGSPDIACDEPGRIAIQCCLTSASALLEVTQTLVQRPLQLTPYDQAEHWKRLVEHTKIAGRSAYRASLALADPESRYN